uniref:Uncharacterized protein n=1 Tax=Romanomermis culicivorax TaxID=13658 RepID=A0A915KAG8_ROMCU
MLGHPSHRVATFFGSVATLAAVGGFRNSTLYRAERKREEKGKEEKREQRKKKGEKERKKGSRGKDQTTN